MVLFGCVATVSVFPFSSGSGVDESNQDSWNSGEVSPWTTLRRYSSNSIEGFSSLAFPFVRNHDLVFFSCSNNRFSADAFNNVRLFEDPTYPNAMLLHHHY